MKYYYRNWLSEVIMRSLGRSINIAVVVRLGGHSLLLFDAANTSLSGDSTTCRGRIEYQNVSGTRTELLIGLT